MCTIDPLLSSVRLDLLHYIEDQLSNNGIDSDDELQADFVQSGLTGLQATQALRYRSLYVKNSFAKGHTPILKGSHALRFDPRREQFELISR